MTAKIYSSLLAASVVGALLGSQSYTSAQTGISAQTGADVPAACPANGFLEDSSLTGTLYYWQRKRSGRNMADGSTYQTNLSHSTLNASLDFKSGYAANVIGFDIGAFTAVQIAEAMASGHPNEVAFSTSKRSSDENGSGDRNGVSLYKAAAKLRYGPAWLRAGYIQPTGQTLLDTQSSFLPGTYQGVESGTVIDLGPAGDISLSYMWANKYKAPWYTSLDNFYRNDNSTKISFLHSFGLKYNFQDRLALEAAYGHAQGYMDQYFAGVGYQFDVAQRPLSAKYQFYGAHDRVPSDSITDPDSNNNLYDGLAWLQAVALRYNADPFEVRLEGTWIRAKGNQGYFLQRMTPGYASSNGRLDIGWDNGSDFNAHGEKALYFAVMYDLSGWQLPGGSVGASYAYGWNARPSSYKAFDQSQRLSESAFAVDVAYTAQQGQLKGMQIKLHFNQHNKHSNATGRQGRLPQYFPG